MIRKNHKWSSVLPGASFVCVRCSCTKQSLVFVGIFILWTYLRPDGIRFTGQAPSCGETTEKVI